MKKSHGRPAPSEPEEQLARKKLKVASSAVTLLVITSSVVTSLVPDPKKKAPAVSTICQSPRLAAGADQDPMREKLFVSSMPTAHTAETRQHFLDVSPPWTRLPMQAQEKGPTCGSVFLGIEEVPQDIHFAVIESGELGEGFGGDGGDSDDDFSLGSLILFIVFLLCLFFNHLLLMQERYL